MFIDEFDLIASIELSTEEYCDLMNQPRGIPPPIGFDRVDTEERKEVVLCIRFPLPSNPGLILPATKTTSADLQWSIRWCMGEDAAGCTYERVIEAEDTSSQFRHAMNWGPLTRRKRKKVSDELHIPLGYLTLEQRSSLSELAARHPVKVSGGILNAQEWITTLLHRATCPQDPVILRGGCGPILSVRHVQDALQIARTCAEPS